MLVKQRIVKIHNLIIRYISFIRIFLTLIPQFFPFLSYIFLFFLDLLSSYFLIFLEQVCVIFKALDFC